MSFQIHPKAFKLARLLGPVLILIVGLALLHVNFRFGRLLTRVSYDWSFDLAAPAQRSLRNSEVMIIYLDEKSHQDLDQPFNRPWDRALHAKLIDRLTADGAKAVVFDILFTDPGPDPQADEALARAMRANGRVILAAEDAPARQATPGQVVLATRSLSPPYQLFQEAAAGWGSAQLTSDEDFVIREHYHGSMERNHASLSWATARLIGLELAKDPRQLLMERWIRYYGRPEAVPHVSYSHVADLHPGFFRDKVVFVGARPVAGSFIERRDELRSPYFTWDENFLFMPMVEVHATVMLNLIRSEWLTRLPPAAESAILLAVAMLFGFGLPRFRPLPAFGVAVGGMVGIVALTIWLFAHKLFWFPWMIVVVAQIPLALLWSVLCRSFDWYVQKRVMEEERRRAQAQIQEQAALLDKARDAIAVEDLQGRICFWNQGAERMYGWSAAEALGQNVHHLLYPDDTPKLAEAQARVLEHGEWVGELQQVAKDRRPILVESRWSLVRDDNHQPKSILVINTDITEKKKLEAQFLRAQRMESIGTLAGGIAHDLNNVLTPIIMSVELLRMKCTDERSLKYLKMVDTSAKRGADMVKQVLSFARGHDGERTALQLNHLIKEMEKIVKETFPKSIEVRTRIASDLSLISGNATQLHQILLNLCVNARDAMPKGGAITITAENAPLEASEAEKILGARPGKYVVLRVVDTGEGIPHEIIDRIFEPFFTTKGIGKGTGLGLSTVLSIVKGHQGFLDLKSEIGRGTTFTIYLPASAATATTTARELDREQLRGNGELVLVVDDEPPIREMLKGVLIDYGYRVVTAADGAEAVSLCTDHQAELSFVVMDMMMPRLDGPAAMRVMGKIKPGLKFIAISGLLELDKMKEQIDTKGVPFLAKPFPPEKLLATLLELRTGSGKTAQESCGVAMLPA